MHSTRLLSVGLALSLAGLAVGAPQAGPIAAEGLSGAVSPAAIRTASASDLVRLVDTLGAESVPNPTAEHVDDHIMIRFRDVAALEQYRSVQESIGNSLAIVAPSGKLEGPAGEIAALLDQIGGRITDTYWLVPGLTVVEIDVPVRAALLAASAYTGGVVDYAEPDYVYHALALPNDSRLNEMYGLNNFGQTGGTPGSDINAAEAWDRWTGDEDFVVMVIDGGVEIDHPDLRDNIFVNENEIPNNGIDDDNNGYIDDISGWDFWENDNSVDEDDFHGSHTSGTVGARGDNGTGVTGVMQRTKIIPMRLLGPGGGIGSKGAKAIEYAVMYNARVSNNSWGGGGASSTLGDAIEAAGESIGHIFVAAAGNDGQSYANDPAGYPLPNIISVAATDHRDRLASFSNYGFATVDVAAPGVGILSTNGGTGYSYASGTSMASPHVAGAVALLYSFRPDWTWQEVVDHLYATVRPVPALDGVVAYGGVIDIGRAITEAAALSSLHLRTDLPGLIAAGETLDLRFTTREMDDPILATPRLFARYGPGGEFVELTLSDEGPDGTELAYASSITAGPGACSTIEFYAQFETQNRGVVTVPEGGASAPYMVPVGEFIETVRDSFETSDDGWTVGDPSDTATAGIWERGIPESTTAQPGVTIDGDYCFITDPRAGFYPGQYDIDGGTTTLTSPVYDVTGALAATLSYSRWFNNAAGGAINEDLLRVEISSDSGATWQELETVGPAGSGTSGGWIHKTFDLADYVPLGDGIRVRFIAEDSNGLTTVEAAIDNVVVETFVCGAAACPADLDTNGSLNNADINLFVQSFLAEDPAADFNADGAYNNADINLFVQAFLAGC